MIDISKFKSPTVFFLAIGMSLIAWYFTHFFILMDKYIPLDFKVQEELIVAKAKLNTTKKNDSNIIMVEAGVEVAEYKREELQKVINSSFKIHHLSFRLGVIFLCLSVPAFIYEIVWQRKVFNKALKSDKAAASQLAPMFIKEKNMKPEEYNPKAREAFGKSLIDIGVSIFKGIILLITVVPASLILKGALESGSVEISIVTLFESMSNGTYFLFICFLGLSLLAGGWFRTEGLRHIHGSEENKT